MNRRRLKKKPSNLLRKVNPKVEKLERLMVMLQLVSHQIQELSLLSRRKGGLQNKIFKILSITLLEKKSRQRNLAL